jgi:hypothetical protein
MVTEAGYRMVSIFLCVPKCPYPVPRADYVPLCPSTPFIKVRFDRRAYQLVLVPPTVSRRSAQPGTPRYLSRTLAGKAYSHRLARTDVRFDPNQARS